jgi:NhaP-type Na+/H+ or K+/H+ antiporter
MCTLSEWISGIAFGCVVGFIAYRTLRRAGVSRVGDLSAVLSSIGGAGVISLLKGSGLFFLPYSVGLFVGFFGYLGLCLALRDSSAQEWLGLPDGEQ